MLCPFIQHDFILISSLNLMWMYGGHSDINDGGKGGFSVVCNPYFLPFQTPSPSGGRSSSYAVWSLNPSPPRLWNEAWGPPLLSQINLTAPERTSLAPSTWVLCLLSSSSPFSSRRSSASSSSTPLTLYGSLPIPKPSTFERVAFSFKILWFPVIRSTLIVSGFLDPLFFSFEFCQMKYTTIVICTRDGGCRTFEGHRTRTRAAGRSRTPRTVSCRGGRTGTSWIGGGNRRNASSRGSIPRGSWRWSEGRQWPSSATQSPGTTWSPSSASCLRSVLPFSFPIEPELHANY